MYSYKGALHKTSFESFQVFYDESAKRSDQKESKSLSSGLTKTNQKLKKKNSGNYIIYKITCLIYCEVNEKSDLGTKIKIKQNTCHF